MIARTLRALGRLNEALEIQPRLKESATKQANPIRTFLKNLNFCTEPSTTVKKPNSMQLAERRRCDFMK